MDYSNRSELFISWWTPWPGYPPDFPPVYAISGKKKTHQPPQPRPKWKDSKLTDCVFGFSCCLLFCSSSHMCLRHIQTFGNFFDKFHWRWVKYEPSVSRSIVTFKLCESKFKTQQEWTIFVGFESNRGFHGQIQKRRRKRKMVSGTVRDTSVDTLNYDLINLFRMRNERRKKRSRGQW